MKILGINGSPRRHGNTEILIKTVFEELEKEGIETEFIISFKTTSFGGGHG